MDVEYLESLHGDTCQDARHQGSRNLDMRIGHEDIKGNEHCGHQHIRQEVYQKAQGGSQEQEVGHGIRYGSHENRDSRSQHDDDGEHEEDGEIVCKGTENTSRLGDLPYLIEGILDIADQHQDGIEHEQQTNTQKDA